MSLWTAARRSSNRGVARFLRVLPLIHLVSRANVARATRVPAMPCPNTPNQGYSSTPPVSSCSHRKPRP